MAARLTRSGREEDHVDSQRGAPRTRWRDVGERRLELREPGVECLATSVPVVVGVRVGLVEVCDSCCCGRARRPLREIVRCYHVGRRVGARIVSRERRVVHLSE